MERNTQICRLLQFLFTLVVSANAGFHSTLDNCIEFDMANLQELVSTLQLLDVPQIDQTSSVDGDREIIQPFGHLKNDWTRLNLLRNALPEDSDVKNKFQHLYRLLVIAHQQATGLSIDNKQSMETEIEEISERPVVKIGEFLTARKEQSGTILTTPISLFARDPLDEITTESFTKLSHNNYSKIKTTALTITATPNFSSDFSGSSSVDISIASTTESDVDDKLSKNSGLETTEEISKVDFSTTFEPLTDSTTENMLKTESNEFSNPEIYSSVVSVEKIQSTSSDKLLESTTEKSDTIFLPSRVKSWKDFVNLRENLSASMATSLETKMSSAVSISREKILPFTNLTKNISSDSTVDRLLTNNSEAETPPEIFAKKEKESNLEPEIYSSNTPVDSELRDYSTTFDSSAVLSTENPSIIASTNEENKEIGSKGTKSYVESENSTPNSWSSTDFTGIWTINSTLRPDVKIEVTPEENQSEVSMTEKSTVTASTTSDLIEITINVTPTIKQDENGEELHYQTETNHQSTTNEWSITELNETAPFATVATETRKIFLPHNSSEITAPIIAEPIEAVSTKSSTEVYTNTAEEVTEPEVASKTKQIDLSTKQSTKANSAGIPENPMEMNATNNFEMKLSNEGETTTTSENLEAISKIGEKNSRPYFFKNPRNIGSLRINKIYQIFKHSSNISGAGIKASSHYIVINESRADAKTGNAWKPSVTRQIPIGNKIFRSGNSNNVRLCDNNRQLTTPIDKQEDVKNSSKFPAQMQDRQSNVLRSRKRGSANDDVEKQFSSYYRTDEANSAKR